MDREYHEKVVHNPPMLHCKVSIPYWLISTDEKKEKFDINWEHNQMKLRLSILNVFAGLFLLGIVVYTIIKYNILSEGEGWGIVFMIGLAGYAAILLVIDIILQLLIKDRKKVNIIGLIIGAIATISILFF